MTKFRAYDIARICHEANRALQVIQDDPTIPVAAPWDQAPDEQQDSVTIGVLGVIGGNTPEESHEMWVRTKTAQGWVHGPTKNEFHKTHPLLVPYAELNEDAKLKDRLFAAIVGACIEGDEVWEDLRRHSDGGG